MTCVNRQKEIIEISKEGWRIIEGSDPVIPILFKKYDQQPPVDQIEIIP